jgi:small nuclear ribonucleoprotein (snRNP)-like protein
MNPLDEHVQSLIGQTVVVDVSSPFIYLGTLKSANGAFLVLADADVHDLRDSETTRELYLLSTLRDGVRRNRREVSVRWEQIVSISKLTDVVDH